MSSEYIQKEVTEVRGNVATLEAEVAKLHATIEATEDAVVADACNTAISVKNMQLVTAKATLARAEDRLANELKREEEVALAAADRARFTDQVLDRLERELRVAWPGVPGVERANNSDLRVTLYSGENSGENVYAMLSVVTKYASSNSRWGTRPVDGYNLACRFSHTAREKDRQFKIAKDGKVNVTKLVRVCQFVFNRFAGAARSAQDTAAKLQSDVEKVLAVLPEGLVATADVLTTTGYGYGDRGRLGYKETKQNVVTVRRASDSAELLRVFVQQDDTWNVTVISAGLSSDQVIRIAQILAE